MPVHFNTINNMKNEMPNADGALMNCAFITNIYNEGVYLTYISCSSKFLTIKFFLLPTI